MKFKDFYVKSKLIEILNWDVWFLIAPMEAHLM